MNTPIARTLSARDKNSFRCLRSAVLAQLAVLFLVAGTACAFELEREIVLDKNVYAVNRVCFSPDDKFLVVQFKRQNRSGSFGTCDSVTFDAATGKLLHTLAATTERDDDEHGSDLNHFQVSDSYLVCQSGGPGVSGIYNYRTGVALDLKAHFGQDTELEHSHAVCFGERAFFELQKDAVLVQLPTLDIIKRYTWKEGFPKLSPSGNRVANRNNDHVEIRSFKDEKTVPCEPLASDIPWFSPKLFSPDETILAVTWSRKDDDAGRTTLFDVATGKTSDMINGAAVHISKSGHAILIGRNEKNERPSWYVYDRRNKSSVKLCETNHFWETEGYGTAEPEVEFALDDKLVFNRPNSSNGKCAMYDAKTGKILWRARIEGGRCSLSPNGDWVYLVGKGIVDSLTGAMVFDPKQIKELADEKHSWHMCTFAHNSRRFIAVINPADNNDEDDREPIRIQIWNEQKTRTDAIPAAPAPIVTKAVSPPPPALVHGCIIFQEPSQQHAPWTAPKLTLPESFVTAVSALFDAGLPDPRGCDYREIEINTRDTYKEPLKTHGWLLPKKPESSEQLAIAWNGVVYSVEKVGAATDVAADFNETIELDRKYVAARLKEEADRDAVTAKDDKLSSHPHHKWSSDIRRSWYFRESGSASHVALNEFRFVYLMRLGYGDLAQKLLEQYEVEKPEKPEKPQQPKDPFAMFANEWLNALCHRAYAAHCSGNDRHALEYFRALTTVHPQLEAEALKRGFKPRTDYSPKDKHVCGIPNNMRELLEDQERRAKEGPHVPALPEPIAQNADLNDLLKKLAEQIPDQKARIARLILELDENTSNYLHGDFQGDWVCWALEREGDAAVLPLIECFEKDKRLTRATAYDSHGLDNYTSILDVRYDAQYLLRNLLEIDFDYEVNDPHDMLSYAEKEAAIPARMRHFAELLRGQHNEERWYRLLADDTASPHTWAAAVEKITMLASTRFMSMDEAKPGSKFHGDPLRVNHSPTVSELLVKRMKSLQTSPYGGAEDMAKALATWDGAGQKNILKEQSDIMKQRVNKHGDNLIWSISDLDIQRARAGDKDAVSEYLAWLETVDPGNITFYGRSMPYQLFSAFPDDPGVLKAVDRIFNSTESPWSKYFANAKGEECQTYLYLKTPMLGLAPFRRCVLKLLADKSNAGTVYVDSTNNARIEFGKRQIDTRQVGADDPPVQSLKSGQTGTFRTCDFAVAILSLVPGFPRCELYWDEASRDRVVVRAGEVLQRYGDNFKDAKAESSRLDFTWILSDHGFDPPMLMRFPTLTQTATPDDVEKGRAIFSLGTGNQTRTFALPKYPLQAKTGYVFQAEEQLIDGKWQRYFGLIGYGVLTKVPAEEIEFGEEHDWGWQRFSSSLSGRLYAPYEEKPPVSKADKLFKGVFELRNHGGLDQTVPAIFARVDGDRRLLLPGVELKLFHDPDMLNFSQDEKHKPNWQPITAKPVEELRDAAQKSLAPTQRLDPWPIDIRNWFDVAKPGIYKLEIHFSKARNGFVDGTVEYPFKVGE